MSKNVIIDVNAFENVSNFWLENKKSLHYGIILGRTDGNNKEIVFSLVPFNKG
jgi:hypothetical protein